MEVYLDLEVLPKSLLRGLLTCLKEKEGRERRETNELKHDISNNQED